MSAKTDKMLEEIDSLTVVELAELVKGIEEKYGVTAAAVAAPAAGGAAGAALGAWGSQYVGTPSTQGLAGYQRVNTSAPARTYRSQRRVGGGRFGKRGHYGDGKALDAQVRLNDGTFGYKYQPATPEYQAYLEGAGGNPSYAVVPIGMKNGGLIPRKK